ncbi:erythrocyte membrane protein 1, EMP1, partial [Plasmodium reichenowi]
MKCHKPRGSAECSDHTPLDDYIPQRLRWMTEWAEWYCKVQSQAYEKLEQACRTCKNNGQSCWNNSPGCTQCADQCKEYGEKVQPWKKQWETIKNKYETLYEQARTEVKNKKPSAYDDGKPDYDQVVHFLTQLIRQSSGGKGGKGVETTNSPYATAGGYIHQEARTRECQEQKLFCNNNGNMDKYVFKDPPKDYVQACGCNKRLEPPSKPPAAEGPDERARIDRGDTAPRPAPPPEAKVDVCEIVKSVLNVKTLKEACPTKYGKDAPNARNKNCFVIITATWISMFLRILQRTMFRPVVATRGWNLHQNLQLQRDLTREHEDRGDTAPRPAPPPEAKVDVCEIVKSVLNVKTLKEACPTKYGKDAPSSWKCVSSGTTGASGKDTGGICVPPRRRKLYVTPLSKWAEKQLKTQEGRSNTVSEGGDQKGQVSAGSSSENPKNSEATLNAASSTSSHTNATQLLRDAFIESAAVETFFLWHRYKKEWEHKNRKSQEDGLGIGLGLGVGAGVPQIPFASPSVGPVGPVGARGPRGPMGPTVGHVGSPGQLLTEPPSLVPFVPVSNGDSVFGNSGSIFRSNAQDEGPQTGLMDYRLTGARGVTGSLTTPVPLGTSSDTSDPNDPKNLSSGTIPPSFLRQMFYTIADYRDILVGVNDDVAEALEKSVYKDPSDDKNNNITMKKLSETIRKAIEKILPKNSDNNQATGGRNRSTGVQTPSQPGDTPSSWWKLHAPSIWKGMVCALTYTDTDPETEEKRNNDNNNKLTKNDDVYNKFFGTTSTPTDNQPTTNNGTFHKQYEYETVKLEQNSDTEALRSNASREAPPSSPANGSTKLAEFVTRPAYFRWLEEWGTEFCGMRKKMLEQLHKECRGENASGDPTYCSGDGHNCEEPDNQHNKMSADPYCPSCYEQCRKYRKWIDLKFEEYKNQKNKYNEEHKKLKEVNSNEDYQKLEGYKSSENFLKELKHCKNDQTDGDQGGEKNSDSNNKIDFDNPLKTFGHSKYCKTCPPKKVNCNGRGGTNECTPDKVNTWQSVFNGMRGNGEKSTIDVQMIDRRAPFIEEYLNESQKSEKSNDSFKTSRLFKGIRKQNWECRYKDKNTDVCKLNNFDPEIDLNEYTTFKVLLIYWLEDFLYGYYLLKKRKIIEKCTQNGEKACSVEGNSKNGCVCVKDWVNQKKKEWDQIKNYYDDNFKGDDEPIYSRIKSFFEQGLFGIDLKKGKGNYKSLEEYEKSVGCYCAENSKEGEDANKKDIVECIHKYLETKISDCKTKHSVANPAQCKDPTPDVEDDDPLEEEENPEEANKMIPQICGDMPKETTKEEPEEKCEEAPSPGEDKKEVDEEKPKGEDATPELPVPTAGGDDNKSPKDTVEEKKAEEKLAPAKPKGSKRRTQRETKPPKLFEIPITEPLQKAMISNTLMWSIGIGFTALSYWFLK